MSSRKPFVTAIVAVGVVLTLARCGQMMVEPVLDITAKPRAIDAAGQKATLTIAATDNQGKPGTGKVTVTSSAGSLSAGEDVVLAAGAGEVEFDCVQATDAKCNGKVTFTATWTTNGKKVETETSLTVTGTAADAGSDAGMVVLDSGVVDAGVLQVVVTTSKARFLQGIQDSATISAAVSRGGTPVANETVSFSTSLGLLGTTAATATTTTATAVTDMTGVAKIKLFDKMGESEGTARVTATALSTTGTVDVGITLGNDITVLGGTCMGTTGNCTILGVEGGSFNETLALKFKVSDKNQMPVADVPVTFVIAGATTGDGGVGANAPAGVRLTNTSGTTDSMGVVTASVTSGKGIGNFSVKAVITAGVLESAPVPLRVRAVRPSNQNMTMSCSVFQISSFIVPQPPREDTIQCSVVLADRQGIAPPIPVNVTVASEIGQIQPMNITTDANGRAQFSITFQQTKVPDNVPGFPARASQFSTITPNAPPVPAEPETGGKNPRDGLITIMAAVTGEEYFDDVNRNGVGDPGEQFYDQGEVLLDRNDDDIWNTGEYYEDADMDGAWTPPNGVWNNNRTIWTSTKVLLTGRPFDTGITLTPSPMGLVRLNSVTDFDVRACDFNGNRLEAGTTIAVTKVGARGSVSVKTNDLALDSYGFTLRQRDLLNSTGTGPCPSNGACGFFTRFIDWPGCGAGSIRVNGEASAQNPAGPPTPITVEVVVTTKGNSGTAMNTGTVE